MNNQADVQAEDEIEITAPVQPKPVYRMWCLDCQGTRYFDIETDGDWEIYTCRACGRNESFQVR